MRDVVLVSRSGGMLLCATSLAYITPMIVIWYASAAGQGVVSALGYASRILVIGVGTVTTALMTVFLPSAALAVAEGKSSALRDQTDRLLQVCVIVSLSAVSALAAEGDFLVRLTLERGHFGPTSTALVWSILIGYLPWVIFFPLSAIAARILYAHKAYRQLAVISATCLPAALVLPPTLADVLGPMGYSLASSLYMTCYATALLATAYRMHVAFSLRRLLIRAATFGTICLAWSLFGWAVQPMQCLSGDAFTVVWLSGLLMITLLAINHLQSLSSVLRSKN